jgi:Ca2+-binding RTX toxin-like protein
MPIAGKGNDKVNGSKGNDVLSGGAGNDVIKGGAGNDNISGGSGTNKLLGGKGKDTFAFAAEFGEHTITGFRPGNDVIRFDTALFADYAAVKGAMSSHNGGVLIGDGDGSVFVNQVKIQKLDADDFIFA